MSRILDIPENELQEYRDAFNLGDKDGSGSISVKEFKKLLKNMGQKISNEEVANLIRKYDSDNSGEIDFEEFVTFMREIKIQEDVEQDIVIKAFMCFDVDKDDAISLEEFRHILCNLGSDRFSQDECDEIFKEADLDHNGELNYREFVDYWRKK